MDINRRSVKALSLLGQLVDDGIVNSFETECSATIYDFGIDAPGGLDAGLWLARLLMADLAQVSWAPSPSDAPTGQHIIVHTDKPLLACMASQYAGWPVQTDDYFAMGSGPMRVARGKEKVLTEYELIDSPSIVIGGLESDQFPTASAIDSIAEQCGVENGSVVLLVAPVTSLAGCVQVVARSIETAMHKLHELGFDLRQIKSACGSAPLPPPAVDMMEGIGRTNDAILYGGEVTLWVECDDEQLEIVAKAPSSTSSAYGKPFVEIFKAHDNDFYKIDSMLFSPASVRMVNLSSGAAVRYGETNDDILRQSFRETIA